MTDQDKNAKLNKVISFLERNSPQKLSEEEMFVLKEEYLDQYRENGFWVIYTHLFQINSFFRDVSYQGNNKKLKNRHESTIKKIMLILVNRIRHRTVNDLHRTNCAKLEEKYVTTILEPNVVAIPI